MKTLYVTDLDGTLMRNDKSISEYSVSTLNRLIEKGILITYATARSFVSARKITEKINFTVPVITRNGTVFANQILNKEIEICQFNADEIIKLKSLLAEIIDTTGFVTAYFNGEMSKAYRKGSICPGLKKYVDDHVDDKRMKAVGSDVDLFAGIVTYITLISTKEELQPVFEKINGTGKWECIFQKDTYSEDFWLEICPKNSTKAKAVLKLKEQLGCDEIVVFGDGVNDLSMFEIADESCAVENASVEVKNRATKIILSNEADGVVKFIQGREM